MFCGLEEDKITGLSIRLSPTGVECIKSFGSRRNYRVLKLVLLPIHSFWRRKSYMVLKSGMANNCNGLQEGKITWFSNDVQYRS